MCINHGRGHLLVSEQFLDCAYVVAALQQVSSEAMPKRVTA